LTEIVNNGTMKKAFLFCTMLLAVARVFSQDYQCIRDNATYFYSDGTNIKAILIDSVVVTAEGHDYYNYPAMSYNTSTGCFSTEGPSWIGRKVIVEPDGDNIFTNKNNKSITIKTAQNLGDFWNCYQFDDGNYIIATIVELQEMGFLGLYDTVKKISFQAFNSGGIPMAHSINQKYLLLSKNYGLIRTINFKVFPDLAEFIFYNEYCTEFTLVGISNPVIGLQNLTAAMVYDFNVDDEIHKFYGYYAYGSYYHEFSYSKNFILQKDFSSNFDTVSYLVSSCGITEQQIPDVGTVYTYSTLDTTINNYFIGLDSVVNVIPDKVIVHEIDPDYWEYSVIITTFFENSGKQNKTDLRHFFSGYPHNCIEEMESEYIYNFIEGLGSYYSSQIPYTGGGSDKPVYYKKGIEEWGVPYNFNCEDFITSDNKISDYSNEVLLSPNPMADWSKLTIDNPENKEYQFQLFNSMGLLVRVNQFRTGELLIQRENLNNGIYFYLLADGQKGIKSGKLIIR
jgi:hypothetical protein